MQALWSCVLGLLVTISVQREILWSEVRGQSDIQRDPLLAWRLKTHVESSKLTRGKVVLSPYTFKDSGCFSLGDSRLLLITLQFLFSSASHLSGKMLLSVYTPGRYVRYGTGSQESGPSQRTSLGRRNTACHHFSRHYPGWGVCGQKWGLWGEEVVRCLCGQWSGENIWFEIFSKLSAFPVYHLLRLSKHLQKTAILTL